MSSIDHSQVYGDTPSNAEFLDTYPTSNSDLAIHFAIRDTINNSSGEIDSDTQIRINKTKAYAAREMKSNHHVSDDPVMNARIMFNYVFERAKREMKLPGNRKEDDPNIHTLVQLKNESRPAGSAGRK